MKYWVRLILLILYGIVGILGWYNYSTAPAKQTCNIVYDRLSPEMTVSYVRSIVWYHSRGKLQELRSILSDDDLSNKERVKIRITNMLKHRTSAYLFEMNNLNTPIEHLGNWYQDNFNFNGFLTDIFVVTFNDNYTIDEKIRYATDVMEEYQNITTLTLVNKLKHKG
ncbi:hypothetical protein AB4427_01720 [Vibrio artabrorum]|uniref:hypothetical protein n=1 Tax=Vibrio artabrorum TaxID=446374 RepID=UPI0035505871